MHTIKLIDKDAIVKSKILNYMCVEEHNIIGGLASSISEVKCQEEIFVKQINLGVNDSIRKVKLQLDYYNLSTDKIVKNVNKALK